MENKNIKDLKNLIEENPIVKKEILDSYPLYLLSDEVYDIDSSYKKFNKNELGLYLAVINQLEGDFDREDNIAIFHNLDNAYKNIKEDILSGYDRKLKDIIKNHQFIENTLTNFIKSLGEEKYIDSKVENLIDLYIDRLAGEETPEDIIKFELDLPENGNRDTWMNLISGIIELSDGKTDKFINESNKVLKLYKKEK